MLANGNTITTVAHYKDAAQRHYQTCKILVEKLNDLQDNEHDNILANIYYLSGYMAECGVKYRCLKTLSFDDAEDSDQQPRWNGIRVFSHLCFSDTTEKTKSQQLLRKVKQRHTLPKYLEKLSGSSVSLTTEEQLLEIMQERWHPDVRYAYESTGLIFNNTSKNAILAFFDANITLLTNLRII
jgi:alanine racemase